MERAAPLELVPCDDALSPPDLLAATMSQMVEAVVLRRLKMMDYADYKQQPYGSRAEFIKDVAAIAKRGILMSCAATMMVEQLRLLR